MKTAVVLILMIIGGVSFAQEKPCNKLPFSDPDVKANYNPVLADSIANNLPERLDIANETGTFKAQIACDGEVKYFIFENGNLTANQQEVIISQASKTNWIPAVKGDRNVTTNVYVEISIIENSTSIRIL